MYWCVFYAPYLALNVTAKLHLLASIVSTHAWSVGERDRGVLFKCSTAVQMNEEKPCSS